jgi:CBS domain-containing protein
MGAMRLREIMQKDVIWVDADTSLAELGALLLEQRISGLPVLSSEGELMGVVSKTDLLRHQADVNKSGKGVREVWEIMSAEVLSAGPDDDVRDVAKKMLERRVHRVVVFENTRMVGIASAFDFLKVASAFPPDTGI